MTRSESWKKKFVKFRRQKELQFFALAGVAYLIIFSIIPMFGIILAFKSYKITAGISGIFTSEWIEVFQRILFRLSILGIVEKHDCFEFIKNDFCISSTDYFSNSYF